MMMAYQNAKGLMKPVEKMSSAQSCHQGFAI
jgi:hypothetical protein